MARKKIPRQEKKKVLWLFIKAKNYAKAKAACKKIERECNAA